MVQIAKRKKGRPSKADLARRSAESPAVTTDSDSRRSLRRRNARYNIIDYDGDYIDEDEEDERKREKKKLKLMAKLHHGEQEQEFEDHAPMEEEECDEIEGGEENEDAEVKHEEDDAIKGTKVDFKGLHYVSVSANSPYGIPLPDKKILDLILDKLQKKDIYGVFADPVDPEELPDYHDVIEHPMDFATVRNKLANGSYSTLEQFENDVFLICSNAMLYNAPETVYHRQARTIQELGRKKFEKLRTKFERSQFELKSEQKTRSNSLVKKSLKKTPGCASQEPVGFDFSSGATLATIGDIQPTFHPMQGGSCERPGNIDGIVEGNTFLIDANQEKSEDVLTGKSMLYKLGRKSFVLDDNRRASYNMPNQPISRSDSTFMTFESGMRQLVTVGVHTEYSYTRSLARFSASLGPIVWKVASHRIQQALPASCKFGRGWVGEYEPLPNPIYMLSNHVQKDTSLILKLHGDKKFTDVEPSTEHPVNGHVLEGKHSSNCPTRGPVFEGNPSIGSAGVKPNQQNAQSRNFGKSENKSLKKLELKSLPSSNQNHSSLVAKFESNTPTAESKPNEIAPRNLNALPSTTFKQPDTNEIVSGELPDGKFMKTSLNRRSNGPSSDSTSKQTTRAAAPFVVRGQEQGVSDPVQSMRMFTEEAQKQQTSSNHSPVGTLPEKPSIPSDQRDNLGNASTEAARAWMSAGAGGFKLGPENTGSPKNQISADSFHNLPREFHQHISRIRGESPGGMSFQSDKNNFPFHAPRPQPIHTGAVSQFSNQPMVFPQSTSADQPRFQMQSPWRGLSPRSQSRQKQETFPPDLNIDCQSPGSPAKQSSGTIDSPQPDLALQL
ncbi:uncharacterized protein [Cicer arietinum]|uniref:Uncharacterized protein LOC101489634 isoform X2 n=1 Tax=Cicer arietinum TaxID=3827 RepID=A0A1S2Y7I7_CICAR|nr:uncharacterized protein LOC101489634 isoform X2 [Cicer arietinum]